MRNSRALIIIGVALLLALGAVLLAAKWMTEQSASAIRVAVSMVDISQGARITGANLQLVEWPAASVPAGAVTDLKVLEGRIARADIGRGEPVLETKLAPAGATGGLSAVVAAGKRAMSVRVNDVGGVAGFALPGNYVDVMASLDGTSDNGVRLPPISKIVLERVLVLAVAQESSRDDTKPRVVNAVTLEVAPDEGERLDLARSIGSLSLVLRNQVDPASVHTVGATRESVLGLPARVAAVDSASSAAAAPAPASVTAPAPAPAVRPRAPRTDGVLVIRGLDAASQAIN